MDNANLNVLGTLAKAGLAGVCIALVSYVAYDRHLDSQLYENHLRNNTEVIIEVKEAVRANTEATKANIAVSRDLEKLLLQINGSK